MSEKRLLVDKLHALARRNFPRRHVIVHGYDDLWQTDVVHPYTRYNRSYHYIFTVIDVLNKHAWVEPLKAKSGDEVMKAIAKIIRDDRRCPKNLHTDRAKGILQLGWAETLEEAQHQPLFYVLRNESLSRTVQPYVEERHVETIYAQ